MILLEKSYSYGDIEALFSLLTFIYISVETDDNHEKWNQQEHPQRDPHEAGTKYIRCLVTHIFKHKLVDLWKLQIQYGI